MKNENITKYRDEFISVGLKIGYLRRQRGMTQEQLAERVGISRQHLGAIEAPRICRPISLDLLFNISTVLGIDPSKLLAFRE